MVATSTDYTLMKLDKIEDMIRELKALLTEKTAPVPLAMPVVEEMPANWLKRATSGKSMLWLVTVVYKHLPMLGTLVYLKATGQSDKILAYLNTFVGL